jgi:hypothetical protein
MSDEEQLERQRARQQRIIDQEQRLINQGKHLEELRKPSPPDPYPAFTKKVNDCNEWIRECKYKVGAKLDDSGLYECLEKKQDELGKCWKKTGDNVSGFVNQTLAKATEGVNNARQAADTYMQDNIYSESMNRQIRNDREKDEKRKEQERDLEEMRRQYPEFTLFVIHAGTGRRATLLVHGNMSFDHLNDRLLKESGFPPFNTVDIPYRGQYVLSEIAGDTLASEGINNNMTIHVYQRLGRGGGTRKRRGKRQKATRKRTTPKRRRKGTRKKRYSK